MSILTKTRERTLPSAKEALSSHVPTWMVNTPQNPQWNYQNAAKEGFAKNELVYACTMEIATSAAEPPLIVERDSSDGAQPLDDNHPLVQLLTTPNAYQSQFEMWSGVLVDQCIAGNAYIEKVRSKSGKVVELWLMRPDFVKVIPGDDFIRGYQYIEPGAEAILPKEDVIHIKYGRNPIDKFYGMGPLQVAAGWTDIDSWTRSFVKAFFQNAGVPSGLLTTTKNLSADEKRLLRESWRGEFSGPGGWNKVAVADGGAGDMTYTPMGLPLGGRGLVVPELEEIASSRIILAFRVPAAIVGIRLSMAHRSLGKGDEDALRMFWTQTLAPIYKRNQDALNRDLTPEFPDVSRIRWDLAQVKALKEDEDALHARWRADFVAGAIGQGEYRSRIGEDPDIPPDDTFMINFNVTPTKGSELLNPPEKEPPPEQLPPGEAPAPKGWERLPDRVTNVTPEVHVHTPKPVRTKKTVVRDGDGQMQTVEEEITYAD